MQRFLLFLPLLTFTLTACAQKVYVGAGSYTTARPEEARSPSDESGQPVAPLKTDGFGGPVPTSDWWTSLAWPFRSPYSEDLYAHPLVFEARPGGLAIRYPAEVEVSEQAYFFDRTDDFLVGVEGLKAPDTRLAEHTDWTVTAAWSDGPRSLRATFGHGLPFAFFEVEGGPALLSYDAPPEIWYQKDEIVGLTVNGHHYGLFGPRGAVWSGTDALRSDLNGAGFFSLALLPDATGETLDFFWRHAYAFVTGAEVRWAYDKATARLTTTFTVTTELMQPGEDLVKETLFALYRHQWRNTDAALTHHAYTSPRGMMKVLAGNGFETTLTFGGVLPEIPSPCEGDDETLYDLIDSLHQQEDLFGGNLRKADTYWQGKAMARLAELVPLADRVGHTAARDRFLAVIRATLEAWLTADDGLPLFAYDDAWRTLIGYPAAFGSDTDLNDHHFHYGYHLQAAATLARYDPAWAALSAWGGMMELLIKDVANADRTDARFPFLRTFDPYAGHSWASGHGGFNDDGNNHESSSEAMNFAAALIRWGVETGDLAARDLGIYLYATERSALEQYWFDVEDAVFPEAFSHTTAAMVWGNGGRYDTWFGDAPDFIHGINYLPFTGASFYLGRHPAYVRSNYEELAMRRTPRDPWPDLALAYLALVDADAARKGFDALRGQGYRPEDGETEAHTFAWIRSLQSLGHVDTTVTANVPTYAVFARDGARRYVAHNPTTDPLAVRFSDGFVMTVPPKNTLTRCAKL